MRLRRPPTWRRVAAAIWLPRSRRWPAVAIAGAAFVVAAISGVVTAVAEAIWLGAAVAASIFAAGLVLDFRLTADKGPRESEGASPTHALGGWSPFKTGQQVRIRSSRKYRLSIRLRDLDVEKLEEIKRAAAEDVAAIEEEDRGYFRQDGLADDLDEILREEIKAKPAPDLAEPRPVARYVVVAVPEAVMARRTFEVSVELLRDKPSDIPDAEEIDVTLSADAAGCRTGEPVTVTIYSAAFEVLGAPTAELDVIPDADPPPAVFQLRNKPAVRGPQELVAAFFQRGRILGEVRLIVRVRAFPARTRVIRRSLVASTLPSDDVPDADVVIFVIRATREGRDTLNYSYEWRARKGRRIEAGEKELSATADEWIRARLETLSEAARRPVPAGPADGPQHDQWVMDYEEIGLNLYRDLFTDELREFYRQFAPTAQTLLVCSDEPWIPWELVKPWGDGVDSDFLCAQFDMSRWYSSEKFQLPNGRLTVREVAPVLPPSNLAAVHVEADYFEQLPGMWPSVGRYSPFPVRSRDDVHTLLISGRAQVLHFAAHGALQPDGQGIASIVLEDGLLRAEQIVGNEILKGLQKATPLVFLNACHTGRQVIGLTKADGWVERYLEMGCRGFLGANWEVNDQLAAEFAIAVYREVVSGSTIASAVREARLQLRARDDSNPTWLAYSLYAHPNLILRPTK